MHFFGKRYLRVKALKPNSKTRSDADGVSKDKSKPEAAKKKQRGRVREKTRTGSSLSGDSSQGGAYNLRSRDKIKKPDGYQYTEDRSSRSFRDPNTKRTQKEERGKYQRKEDNTKYKGESPISAEVSVK